MNDMIPLHLQSIIHFINNYDFSYKDNQVTATVDQYLEMQELTDLLQKYRQQAMEFNENTTDRVRKDTLDAINELQLAISELEKASGSNNQ
jgi:competence transcription factor ComK